MAEIEIERKPRRSPWAWIALLLILAAIAVGAWLVFGDDGGTSVEPADRAVIEEPAGVP